MRTDHPRSCGANGKGHAMERRRSGSSPLVRGQLNANNNVQDAIRIIPARAGPTCAQQRHVVEESDHPRSCGANYQKTDVQTRYHGSSPLVRGQLTGEPERLLLPRIIPARAGPTRRPMASGRQSPDHPRSCGANRISRHAISCYSGSSPLVRGQRWCR